MSSDLSGTKGGKHGEEGKTAGTMTEKKGGRGVIEAARTGEQKEPSLSEIRKSAPGNNPGKGSERPCVKLSLTKGRNLSPCP